MFSGPQIRDVSAREGAKVIIYDDEYTEAVKLAETPLGNLRALGSNPDAAEPSGSTDETLAEVIARSSTEPAPKAPSGRRHHPDQRHDRHPEGCQPACSADAGAHWRSALECAVQGPRVTSLPSPMFHALGYLHATIAMTLGSTLVLATASSSPPRCSRTLPNTR